MQHAEIQVNEEGKEKNGKEEKKTSIINRSVGREIETKKEQKRRRKRRHHNREEKKTNADWRMMRLSIAGEGQENRVKRGLRPCASSSAES